MSSAVMLSDVAELVMGQSPPSTCYNDAGDGLPFYQGKTDFGATYPTPRIYCSEPKKVAEAGDILISVRAPVGATNLCDSKSCIGRGIAAIRVHGIDRDFLYFYLKKIEPYIESLGSGAIFKAITKSQLAELPINDAGIPLPEQKKIAHILSTVQRAIEAQERIIHTTTELKKALMHKLFTEGLRGEPQKQTEIGPIPESWEVVKIGNLDLDIGDGNYSTKYPSQSAFISQGIPFLRAVNLKKGRVVWADMRFISPELHSELRKGHTKRNDTILVTRGNIGEVAFVTDEFVGANMNAQLVRLNGHERINGRYLFYCLEHPERQKQFLSLTTGTALKQLPIGKLKTVLLPIPPIDEQEEIGQVLRATEQKGELAQSKKAALEGLFRTLLHELMTAKTRVHEVAV